MNLHHLDNCDYRRAVHSLEDLEYGVCPECGEETGTSYEDEKLKQIRKAHGIKEDYSQYPT